MTKETVWNIDAKEYDYSKEARDKFLAEKGFDKNTHPKYKIGDTIQFYSGYNDDILMQATIKGLDKDDIYVYNDCYWFPIQDDEIRQIVIIL